MHLLPYWPDEKPRGSRHEQPATPSSASHVHTVPSPSPSGAPSSSPPQHVHSEITGPSPSRVTAKSSAQIESKTRTFSSHTSSGSGFDPKSVVMLPYGGYANNGYGEPTAGARIPAHERVPPSSTSSRVNQVPHTDISPVSPSSSLPKPAHQYTSERDPAGDAYNRPSISDPPLAPFSSQVYCAAPSVTFHSTTTGNGTFGSIGPTSRFSHVPSSSSPPMSPSKNPPPPYGQLYDIHREHAVLPPMNGAKSQTFPQSASQPQPPHFGLESLKEGQYMILPFLGEQFPGASNATTPFFEHQSIFFPIPPSPPVAGASAPSSSRTPSPIASSTNPKAGDACGSGYKGVPTPTSFDATSSDFFGGTPISRYAPPTEDILNLHMTAIKGVENPIGENHCFLNVLIQSFYRLTDFRENFLRIAHIHHKSRFEVLHRSTIQEAPCVLCALQTVLNAYKQTEDNVSIDPIGVRMALAALDRSFGRHEQADASDAMHRILDHLHTLLTTGEHPPPYSSLSSSTKPTTVSRAGMNATGVKGGVTTSSSLLPSSTATSTSATASNCCENGGSSKCIIHRLLGLSYLEVAQCHACGDVVHSHQPCEWVHNVYAEKLRRTTSQFFSGNTSMASMIAKADESTRTCDQCRIQCRVQRHLSELPPVLTLGINWPEKVAKDDISRVLSCLDTELNIAEMFAPTMDQDVNRAKYRLQGFVSYYGSHYITYQNVRMQHHHSWIRFNDRLVTNLGSWSKCKEAVTADCMRPLIVWFVKM